MLLIHSKYVLNKISLTHYVKHFKVKYTATPNNDFLFGIHSDYELYFYENTSLSHLENKIHE